MLDQTCLEGVRMALSLTIETVPHPIELSLVVLDGEAVDPALNLSDEKRQHCR